MMKATTPKAARVTQRRIRGISGLFDFDALLFFLLDLRAAVLTILLLYDAVAGFGTVYLA